jgi:hypothetical protein
MVSGLSKFLVTPAMKALALCAVAVFLFAVVATGGCNSSTAPIINASPQPSVKPSGSPGPSPSPTPTRSPSPSPTPTPSPVNFVIMNYPSVPPTTDPTYGEIDGYGQATAAPTTTPIPTVVSQVVTVHCNQTIKFYNLDRTSSRTASLLGVAAGMNWPPTFNNVNGAGTASPAFTAITTPEFSTGNLFAYPSTASISALYMTGPVAGSFYFGDYYDYLPLNPKHPQMRTVITVVCP